MNAASVDDVRTFVTGFVQKKLAAQGHDQPHQLSDECDLLLSGLIDSLGLLELVTAVTQHYGREIDFEMLDPEQMTIVGPLCRFVAESLSAPSSC